jgi:hypothetical protein
LYVWIKLVPIEHLELLHLLLVGATTFLFVIDHNSEVQVVATTADNLEFTRELTACYGVLCV